MQLWHLSSDAPRVPDRVSPGERIALHIGTWPIAPGQSVWVTYRVDRRDGSTTEGQIDAAWHQNLGVNSYWCAELGPFADADRVTYRVAHEMR